MKLQTKHLRHTTIYFIILSKLFYLLPLQIHDTGSAIFFCLEYVPSYASGTL